MSEQYYLVNIDERAGEFETATDVLMTVEEGENLNDALREAVEEFRGEGEWLDDRTYEVDDIRLRASAREIPKEDYLVLKKYIH